MIESTYNIKSSDRFPLGMLDVCYRITDDLRSNIIQARMMKQRGDSHSRGIFSEHRMSLHKLGRDRFDISTTSETTNSGFRDTCDRMRWRWGNKILRWRWHHLYRDPGMTNSAKNKQNYQWTEAHLAAFSASSMDKMRRRPVHEKWI